MEETFEENNMIYGKRCVCGHSKNTHNCGQYTHGLRSRKLKSDCNCGCHGFTRRATKTGRHIYKLCKCKEYTDKKDGLQEEKIAHNGKDEAAEEKKGEVENFFLEWDKVIRKENNI